MKIATWNVNSLRVRLPQVLQWLQAHKPDLLALQETKLEDTRFPEADFQAAGYHALYSGQKTYNGVAILARGPGSDRVTDIPGLDDPQRRVLGATFGRLRLINLYVPNGEAVDSPKYAYKLDWLDKLTGFLSDELARHEQLVVVGDFNIAPDERDVYDPLVWEGRVLFSQPEREAFKGLEALGLCDTFRLFDQPDGSFSWWDYRMRGFARNLGLRIDHVLASRALCDACTGCRVDKEPRGWERPSDHAPVVAQFEV
ncbi:MAG TPA: exodeoxyribonuclease III [Gammaproteobacteria bacterium]|nr:exodeoxyribonuclease III [Gammaproteobacteria bacterium]